MAARLGAAEQEHVPVKRDEASMTFRPQNAITGYMRHNINMRTVLMAEHKK